MKGREKKKRGAEQRKEFVFSLTKESKASRGKERGQQFSRTIEEQKRRRSCSEDAWCVSRKNVVKERDGEEEGWNGLEKVSSSD